MNDERPAEQRRGARRTMAMVSSGIAGGLFGLVVIVLLLVWRGRSDMPRLTRERLAAAQARWQQTAPTDYDLEVEVQTRQREVHRVEVRDGRVASYRLNGRPMTRRRTFGTWTVEGMFATLQRDLEHVEQVAAGQADPQTPQLRLWAEFDPHYGFPRRYRRTQWGEGSDVSWRVTHFQVIEAGRRGTRPRSGDPA